MDESTITTMDDSMDDSGRITGDSSSSAKPTKWLYSYGGHVRTPAERILGESLPSADGWVTPRDMKSSLQGLRALSDSAVLREDVCQAMTAVVQGKDPLIAESTLHSITMSAEDLAALNDSDVEHPDARLRSEMSVRVDESVVSWPQAATRVEHRLSGYVARGDEREPDVRRSSRGAARHRESISDHPESVGSQAFRGGRSSQLKYIRTPAEIEQQKKMQRDLENSVDVAHAQLDQSIKGVEEVDGVKSTSWDKQCAGKGRDLDRLVSMQRQRQAVIRDSVTAKHNREAIAGAEGGRVIWTLLQFLTPRYAVSTQREAIWTMTLLADEPQARRAFRANRCFPRLLKLTSTKAESVVEAVCQLLARLAYDEECAETMLRAGGIPLLKGLTQFPNFKVRELAKDIIDALEETQTWMED